MNKIFKVIWNYATQSWVAVSELQKANGKTKSLSLGAGVAHQSYPTLKFSLISSGLLLASGQVIAVTGTVDSSTTGQCYSDKVSRSIVCGDSPAVQGAIAIGFEAKPESGGYAIGHHSVAEGGAVAFGPNAGAVGDRSGAIGTLATATDDYSWALGYDSRASGLAAVAIGKFSTSMHNYSVALGASSVTEDVVGTKSAEINSIQYGDFAGDTPIATVSVGNEEDGEKRTITNVAAGRINKDSTDAINGSQLYWVADKLSAGFTLKHSATSDGEEDGIAEEKIKPGDIVEMIAGKNLQVKQEADGKITYATKDEVTFTTVNATTVNVGDTTINNDGLIIKNGPSITKDGLNAGNKVISNVSKGVADNDAVNVSQLKEVTSNITNNINNLANNTITLGGDNGTTTSAQALNKEGGLQFDVNGGNGISTTANGSSITVTAKTDGTTIKIDASGNIAANTGNVTIASNVDTTDAAGNVIPAGKVSVASGEGSKVATVQNVADAINNAGWVVNTGKAADQNSFDTAAVNHQSTKISAGSKVNFQAGKNMEVKREGENIIYATSDNVSFNTVTVGNTNIGTNGITINNGPSMTTDGINAGNKVISNVAPGVKDNDAVNVSQLKGAVNNINSQLNKMDKRRKAGHASGLAVAGLMQAYREGQSAMTAGVGQYQNQSAVAVGYSRIADSGKYGVKAAFTANTQGEVGGTLSAGYFW
ncbi:ESPR-type extended signal peptide-containing protein [Rodentibacter genomosp. 2]|uniref:Adhesin n=1 Tax=Rodentibacter genomosp. 2 TaxID=1908266 RepID=A0A1V3JC72_9PAST|nr:ESPR-type extended signal peptide-containing protein [Rodentibacter genomosp. 2]OOF54238.1 hypothetical protein BKK55_09780 [Rodentibacter genomosp. 2]